MLFTARLQRCITVRNTVACHRARTLPRPAAPRLRDWPVRYADKLAVRPPRNAAVALRISGIHTRSAPVMNSHDGSGSFVGPGPDEPQDVDVGSIGGSTSEDWRKALAQVVPCVVVLRVTAVRAFDTESAGSSYATGFVVDRARGLILTNRHVVKPGPVVAEAVFLNREEIPVMPLYRDPVHDFGFFRFDPKALQFMQCSEVPLRPEAAAVGLEVRVVGNDSGEKVSILAGTLARLDRDAPSYSPEGYNDFNTFYLQAASGTKGGSSGSPVIDCRGHAVALNAGSKTKSASAFFLPLHRVVRVLRILQGYDHASSAAPVIPRGTLQTIFVHRGFDETRRLGLQRETEQLVRGSANAGETGMLVVETVVPHGPAHKALQPGDILVKMNGQVTTQFQRVSEVLDDSVGKGVALELERGGQPIVTTLTVQDLHSITPRRYLEVSGAVVHSLSYQQARNFSTHCGQCYVADPGYMLSRAGVPRHAIIHRVAGHDTPSVDALTDVLLNLADGARVPLEYTTSAHPHQRKSVIIHVDRRWYPAPAFFERDDRAGLWLGSPATPSARPLDVPTPDPLAEPDAEAKSLSPEPAKALAPEVAKGRKREREDGSDGTEKERERVEPPAGTVLEVFPDGWNPGGGPARQGTVESEDGPVVGGEGAGVGGFPGSGIGAVVADVIGARDGARDGAQLGANGLGDLQAIVEKSLAQVEVHIPPVCLVDGVHGKSFEGTGLVVYHTRTLGLIAVDRNTVPVSPVDVTVSFAAHPVEVPAEVVFLHPVANLAILSYQIADIGGPDSAAFKAIKPAKLMPEPHLRQGDEVHLVGLLPTLRATSRRSTVTNAAAVLSVPSAAVPRFRSTNEEAVVVDTDFGTAFSGVLAHTDGAIRALWSSYSRQGRDDDHRVKDYEFVCGQPVETLASVLALLTAAAPPGGSTSGVRSAGRGDAFRGAGVAVDDGSRGGDGARSVYDDGGGRRDEADGDVGREGSGGVTAGGGVTNAGIDPAGGKVSGSGNVGVSSAQTNASDGGLSKTGGDRGLSNGGLENGSGYVSSSRNSSNMSSINDKDDGVVNIVSKTDKDRSNNSVSAGTSINEPMTRPVVPLTGASNQPQDTTQQQPQQEQSPPREKTGELLQQEVLPGRERQGGSANGQLVSATADGSKDIIWGGCGRIPRGNPVAGGWIPSPPDVAVFDAELRPLPLAKARSFGLSERWAQVLKEHDPERSQVLQVKACVAGTQAAQHLQPGDLLLAIDGVPVVSFQGVHRACAATATRAAAASNEQGGRPLSSVAGDQQGGLPLGREGLPLGCDGGSDSASVAREGAVAGPRAAVADDSGAGSPTVHLRILRNQRELDVVVTLSSLSGAGVGRVLHWAGTMLQAPHRAVKELGYLPEQGSGIFISRWYSGSPAHRYGLYALSWIQEVNGRPTADLDAFIQATTELANGSFVRLKTTNLQGKVKVMSLKLDLHFWPTWELRRSPEMGVWERIMITQPNGIPALTNGQQGRGTPSAPSQIEGAACMDMDADV